jgi:peptidoglycan L-alanyl-D-glutamate endopeptidase CwlK
MGQKLTFEDTLFVQRLLKAQGLYRGVLDGQWGRQTEGATRAADLAAADLREIGTFDSRSEAAIAGLHLLAQERARRLLGLALGNGFAAKIISGTRTYAEQNALYQQGRFGNRGPRVTKARGGQSNHNFAIAFDVGLFDSSGRYLAGDTADEIAEYRRLGETVRTSGLELEWGGDWKFVDVPHYQVPTNGRSVAETRKLFEAGLPYV